MLISKTRKMHALPLSTLTMIVSLSAALIASEAEATDLKSTHDKIAHGWPEASVSIQVTEEKGQPMTLADIMVEAQWRQKVAESLRERQKREALEGLDL